MNELQAQVAEKAVLAVAQFQERAGGTLDYSQSSLASIEEMLDEASNFASEIGPDQVNALVELAGSYILMVAFKKYGGDFLWFDQRNQPILVVGEPEFHVALGTFDRVRSRLGGDSSDNIPFFYQGFADRASAAVPGSRVLVV